jgi:hypothetical protein
MKPYRGPPMTLSNAAAAQVRLIVWCLDCHHQVEPDPAEMAMRYGTEATNSDRISTLCAHKPRLRCAWSSGVSITGIRSSPTRRRWPSATVLRWPSPFGMRGLYARGAGPGASIWW